MTPRCAVCGGAPESTLHMGIGVDSRCHRYEPGGDLPPVDPRRVRPAKWEPVTDERNAEWTEIGSFGVDSASCWIGDVVAYHSSVNTDALGTVLFSEDAKKKFGVELWPGVGMWCGLGDGSYKVMGRAVDVGGGDMRLAEIRVVFITEEDIRDWQQ